MKNLQAKVVRKVYRNDADLEAARDLKEYIKASLALCWDQTMTIPSVDEIVENLYLDSTFDDKFGDELAAMEEDGEEDILGELRYFVFEVVAECFRKS